MKRLLYRETGPRGGFPRGGFPRGGFPRGGCSGETGPRGGFPRGGCSGIVFMFLLLLQVGTVLNIFAISLHTLKRPDGTILTSRFSPQNNIIDLIIDCINEEQESITVLAYCFTQPRIAKALERQFKQKKVSVLIIADHSMATNGYYNKTLRKLEQVVDVKLYQPPDNGIMHNKCILFSKNIDNKPLLITGSFNFTRSAQKKNCENIIISNEKELYTSYKKIAADLEKKSTPFTEIPDKQKYKNVRISVKREV